MTKGICKLCGLESALIKSHIIPKSFYIKGGGTLINNQERYTKRSPTGIFSLDILCGNCDNTLLSDLDNYAKKIILDHEGVYIENVKDPSRNKSICVYRLDDKRGYCKLARFFISVLWRAAVSKNKDFKLNLGPYEDLAKQVILDESFDFTPYFSICLCYFEDKQFQGIMLFSDQLVRLENGVNTYCITMNCIKVFIRCDKRQLPDSLKYMQLSEKNDILMLQSKFENFFEYSGVLALARKKLR